jgi:hypothetical protein
MATRLRYGSNSGVANAGQAVGSGQAWVQSPYGRVSRPRNVDVNRFSVRSVFVKLCIYGYLMRVRAGRRLKQETQRIIKLLWWPAK